MSYHVTLPATQRTELHPRGGHATYSVGTFAGGKHGPMVQLTVGGEYVALTRKQQKELRRVLKHVKRNRRHGLYGYPGAS